MQIEVCYHTGTGIISTVRDVGSSWGTKEKDGNPLKVAEVSTTQTIVDYANSTGPIISDSVESGCCCVDDIDNPTSIIIAP